MDMVDGWNGSDFAVLPSSASAGQAITVGQAKPSQSQAFSLAANGSVQKSVSRIRTQQLHRIRC